MKSLEIYNYSYRTKNLFSLLLKCPHCKPLRGADLPSDHFVSLVIHISRFLFVRTPIKIEDYHLNLSRKIGKRLRNSYYCYRFTKPDIAKGSYEFSF